MQEELKKFNYALIYCIYNFFLSFLLFYIIYTITCNFSFKINVSRFGSIYFQITQLFSLFNYELVKSQLREKFGNLRIRLRACCVHSFLLVSW